jgi:hypothetical protein
MRILLRVSLGALAAAMGTVLLAGCGGQQSVKPKAIAFEPAIVGRALGAPAECTSATAALERGYREARNHLCSPDKPTVLVKADGSLRCVAKLPSAGPTIIDMSTPSAVQAHGQRAVAYFKAGETVAARSGCLACHRIGEAGNNGPGANLTHIGARLSPTAIDRALVDSPEPMPSFSHLPEFQRRALVDFLTQLR